MNCKPGELAIIVKALNHKNLGLLVYVVAHNKTCLGGPFGHSDWLIEGEYFGKTAGCGHAADCQLRPIRDTPGADETLQWAPVPGERVTA